jgi:hypothetical protein
MSTIKPYDYGAWTRKNLPSLTVAEQNLLSAILSVGRPSHAFLLEIQATPEASAVAISATLSSIKASYRPGTRLTAGSTLMVHIEERKHPAREPN